MSEERSGVEPRSDHEQVAPRARNEVDPPGDSEVRDELPADLNAAGYVGPYKFPDNSRRRIPGYIYLGAAAVCVAIYLAAGDDAVLVNGGFLFAAALLAAAGIVSITSGWHMKVDEKDALLAATATVGFPVGHASAQLAWRGLRSRPTWRILAYSAEEPPQQRGFVLVDAIDGEVVSSIVEENPESFEVSDRPLSGDARPAASPEQAVTDQPGDDAG